MIQRLRPRYWRIIQSIDCCRAPEEAKGSVPQEESRGDLVCSPPPQGPRPVLQLVQVPAWDIVKVRCTHPRVKETISKQLLEMEYYQLMYCRYLRVVDAVSLAGKA